MKLQSKPRLLMMIRIMLLTVYIYALNRKARPSRVGIYFRLSSCFHREIMYRSVIPKARRPSGRKRLILEKLFQGCSSLCYCHLVPMTHSFMKSLHGPQCMKCTFALCRMHWPRGSLFGQCMTAFIYSAFSAMTAGVA